MNMIQKIFKNLHGYNATKMSSFPTDDGLAWSAQINKGKTPVLIATNEGIGGPTSCTVINNQLFLEFKKIAVSLKNFEPIESLAETIADETQNLKRIQRACKKSVVFQVTDDEEGEYRVYKVAPEEKAYQALRNHFKEKLVCIFNEELLKPEYA